MVMRVGNKDYFTYFTLLVIIVTVSRDFLAFFHEWNPSGPLIDRPTLRGVKLFFIINISEKLGPTC